LHVHAARADDLVDARYTLRAQSQRGDGLGPAHAVDLGDAQLAAHGQDGGVDVAVVTRRRDDGDFFDAGDLCGQSTVDDRGQQGGGSARHAHAHTPQRPYPQRKRQPLGLNRLRLRRQDRCLKSPDGLDRLLDRRSQRGVRRRLCPRNLLDGDAHLVRRDGDMVDAGGDLTDGLVTATADIANDVADGFCLGRLIEDQVVQQQRLPHRGQFDRSGEIGCSDDAYIGHPGTHFPGQGPCPGNRVS